MNLREVIISIVKPLIKKHVRTGKARNINLNKCTCDVELGEELYLYGVKLKAIEGGNNTGVVCEPVEGSMVQCAMVEGVDTNWVLVACSEVKSFTVITEKSKLEVLDNGEVHLNGKDKGSTVVLEELVKRLNEIENKHNALVAEYNAHTHLVTTYSAVPNGQTPTPPPVVSSTSNVQPITTIVDLENPKVKHGSGS